MLFGWMRLIARKHLKAFWEIHPETKAYLSRWENVVRAATGWKTMSDIQASFPKAKVLNDQRVRFEVHHNDFRLIVAFDLKRQVAFVKFLGTHKAYDAIDPFEVAQF